MWTIAGNIFNLIRRNALLGIYPIFILVQCFCYSQYSPDFTIDSAQVVSTHKGTNVANGLISKGKPCTIKCQFRLNKRFLPETVPVLAYSGVEIPVSYVDGIINSGTKEYLLISEVLASQLRGPPHQALL